MRIAYNPKTAAALTTAPANNDITFDLSGLSIYVKGVRFKGTDTTYSVFKKHDSSGSGYNGLVPVPSYNNDSKNRYLREDGTWVIPTHYTTHLYIGEQSVSNNNNSNSATTNGNTYIKLFDNSTLRHLYLIKGYGNTTVNSDASGNITINSPTTISWDNVTGKPESFIPATHYHDLLTNWPDTRSVATTPNDYNAVTSNGGVFKVSGIKTAETTLGLPSTLVGYYATIIGWRGWKDKSGGYAWEIASTDKNRLYVRSGYETTWNNGWSAIAYTTDNFPTSQINKLTGYTIATSIANLATTDTLNVALGKLEYKLNVAYDTVYYLLINGSLDFTPAETEITNDTLNSSHLKKTVSIVRGSWNYAGNGYTAASTWGNIDLAGTTIIKVGGSTSGYTQLFITPNTASTTSALKGEMLYYIDNGDSYTPTWYRVLTNANYTSYINTTNFPGLNQTGTVTSVSIANGGGLSVSGSPIITSGTITITNTGVRSTTINGNYLRVNTNGENTDLTIPYATKAKSLTNYYSSRPTTINPGITGDGGMFQFKCTSSVTDTTTDPGDGHILHFNWDNTGGYDAQLFLSTSLSALKVRGMDGGTWRSWATVLTDVNSLVSGGGSSWGSSITVNLGGTSKTLTIPSKPTLSVITSGSGNAITDITVSDLTLTLKKETNFASGQDTSYKAGGTAKARWVRIASTSSYNAFGIISICNSYYNNATTSVTFVFNTGYTNSSNPSITLIGGSRGVFTKARIVKGNTEATSETAYIEIYYNTTSTNNTLYINLANARNTSLYTTYTEGSIPTNYVTFERNFIEDGFSGNGYYKQGSSNSYVLLGGGGDFGLHTGRNNEANKVVRTDASGYIYAGWINTTSGDMGTTDVTKIYCSNDNFIRYKTPAQFFSTLANDANLLSITVGGLNRKLTVSYANSAGTSSKVTVTDSTTKYKILGANGEESLSVYRLTATVGSSIKPIYLSGGVPTECSYSFKGLSTLPVVLVSGYFYRNYLNLNIWYFNGYKHSEIGSPTFSVSGGVMTLTFSNTVNVYFISACAQSRLNFSGSGNISTTQSATNTEYSWRSEGAYWFNTYVSNSSTTSYLCIRSYRLADSNNDSWASYASSWKLEEDAIQSVSFTIFGYI